MRILLVQHVAQLAACLKKRLNRNGFAVDWITDGLAADHLLQTEQYQLVILDIILPRLSGLALLGRIRKRGQVLPVLLLTSPKRLAERVCGLNQGADDCLTRPKEQDDLLELEARIRALLRRQRGELQWVQVSGQLKLHPEGYFTLNETPLPLTPREASVLTTLMHRCGRPVSRQQLYEQTFTLADEASPKSIELYVHRLRKKLSGTNVAIETLRGVGYKLQCV